MEHVETTAEVQQWLMEQEGVSVTMCGCGQTSHDCLCPFFFREASEDEAVIDDNFRFT